MNDCRLIIASAPPHADSARDVLAVARQTRRSIRRARLLHAGSRERGSFGDFALDASVMHMHVHGRTRRARIVVLAIKSADVARLPGRSWLDSRTRRQEEVPLLSHDTSYERNRARSTRVRSSAERRRPRPRPQQKGKKKATGRMKWVGILYRRGTAARNVISGALTILQISLSRESRDLIITDKRDGELGHSESFGYMISQRIRIKESSFYPGSPKGASSASDTNFSASTLALPIFFKFFGLKSRNPCNLFD